MQGSTGPVTPISFLTTAFFNAWQAHPSSGTIAGPGWAASARDPGFRRRLLIAPAVVESALAASRDALRDCDRYQESLRDSCHSLPQPFPAPAAGWILHSFRGAGANGGMGTAVFERSERPKRIEIDLRDPGRSVLEVGKSGARGEIAQKISIGADHRVSTESYFFRTRFKNLGTAADFAAAVSTLIYDSGQYDVENELGPLVERDAATGRETPMTKKKGRFSFTGPISLAREELLIVSAASVFAPENPDFREPVVSVTISPLKMNEPSSVSILLYRPPARPEGRMPLQPRLKNVLWEGIGRKIS
jgi:hypothetical protein